MLPHYFLLSLSLFELPIVPKRAFLNSWFLLPPHSRRPPAHLTAVCLTLKTLGFGLRLSWRPNIIPAEEHLKHLICFISLRSCGTVAVDEHSSRSCRAKSAARQVELQIKLFIDLYPRKSNPTGAKSPSSEASASSLARVCCLS